MIVDLKEYPAWLEEYCTLCAKEWSTEKDPLKLEQKIQNKVKIIILKHKHYFSAFLPIDNFRDFFFLFSAFFRTLYPKVPSFFPNPRYSP